jgi:hypothetical protein
MPAHTEVMTGIVFFRKNKTLYSNFLIHIAMNAKFFFKAYLNGGPAASASDLLSWPCAGLATGLAQTPPSSPTLTLHYDSLCDVLCPLPPAEQCLVVHVLLKALHPDVSEDLRQLLIVSFPQSRATAVTIAGNYYQIHDNTIFER